MEGEGSEDVDDVINATQERQLMGRMSGLEDDKEFLQNE
jgi:hypothetical protein